MQSFDREREPVTEPSAWITRYARLVPPGGQVLDLACGHGRHARWLLDKGYRVLAADIDTSAVIDLCEHPHAEVLEVDLESGDWPFPPGSFAGIVVANYLHRPHFPHLVEALTDGGVLLFETFARGNEAFGKPRNPDFLLGPGELLDAFQRRLQIVAYEHGLEWRPRPAVRQRLCAVKGDALQTLPGDR